MVVVRDEISILGASARPRRWLTAWLFVALAPAGAAAETAPLPPTAARINGVYRSAENTISLLDLGRGKVRVELALTNGPSEGYALGDAKLRGDTVIYTEPPKEGCRIELKLLPHDELDVGVVTDCGFPPHNGASGHYRKLKAGPPKLALGAPVPSNSIERPSTLPSASVVSQTLASTVRLDHDDAQISARAASEARAALEPLLARRKTEAPGVKDAQKTFDQHASAAASALRRVQSAGAKKLVTPAVQQDLALARQELELAQQAARALEPAANGLYDLDRNAVELVTRASSAATDAAASSKEAADAVLALSSSEKALLAAAAKAKPSKATADEATNATTLRQEAERLAKETKASAGAASADAAKARTLAGGSPDVLAQKLKRTLSDNNKRLEQARDKVDALLRTSAGIQPPTAANPSAAHADSGNPIPGASDLPVSELKKRFGSDQADEIMQAHPEIVAAMQRFDGYADVLVMPHEARLVRTARGREPLLLSGRTCRACGERIYWVAWDAKAAQVAFANDADGSPPAFGANDAELRALLDHFTRLSSP